MDLLINQMEHGKGLPLPCYSTTGSSGMDFFAAVPFDAPVCVKPLERSLIPTGVRISLPEGYEMQVRPRSGIALSHGVTVLNSPGTIDSDYRGEIKVLLINLGQELFRVVRGLRIAQGVVSLYVRANVKHCEELPQSVRANSGFGSTGLF